MADIKPMMLRSCFYEGRVFHERTQPKHHAFEYSVAMVYLNLSELDGFFEQSRFWSKNRPALARFRREDYYGDAKRNLESEIKTLVENKLGLLPDGDVCLLTNLCYFGYSMNPLSTYYCFNKAGKLVATVAEVNNTPWGEKHCYVLPAPSKSNANTEHAFNKAFTVSPFNAVDMQYQWRSSLPDDSLEISIKAMQGSDTVVRAYLDLHRKPAHARSMNRFLIRFPFHTLKVISSIYFEALRLYLKGVPFLGRNYIENEKSLESKS